MAKNTGCPRCDELGPNVYCSICMDKKYGALTKRRTQRARSRARTTLQRHRFESPDGRQVKELLCRRGHRWPSAGDYRQLEPFDEPYCPDPSCGERYISARRPGNVNITDTECTRECWDAKGPDCSCSCGRVNHGKTWREAAA